MSTQTTRDPRWADALALGYRCYDADRAAGILVARDRDGQARAFAQIATALPSLKPRRLAPVRPILAAFCEVEEVETRVDDIHRIAGAR